MIFQDWLLAGAVALVVGILGWAGYLAFYKLDDDDWTIPK